MDATLIIAGAGSGRLERCRRYTLTRSKKKIANLIAG